MPQPESDRYEQERVFEQRWKYRLYFTVFGRAHPEVVAARLRVEREDDMNALLTSWDERGRRNV
jgi:hypothetical protein